MPQVLLVIHLMVAIALIGIVMMQRSEGGALGIGGGGGGSGSIFSSRGLGNGLTRATAWLGLAFFCTSILLTIISAPENGSIVDRNRSVPAQPATQSSTVPVAPATPQVPVATSPAAPVGTPAPAAPVQAPGLPPVSPKAP